MTTTRNLARFLMIVGLVCGGLFAIGESPALAVANVCPQTSYPYTVQNTYFPSADPGNEWEEIIVRFNATGQQWCAVNYAARDGGVGQPHRIVIEFWTVPSNPYSPPTTRIAVDDGTYSYYAGPIHASNQACLRWRAFDYWGGHNAGYENSACMA